MDINDIKAGTYELVALRWDEPTSKPGEPFTFVRHRRGDKVELSESEAKRLVLAGAVVEPGALERSAAERARREYEAALAQVPDVVRAEMGGAEPSGSGGGAAAGGDAAGDTSAAPSSGRGSSGGADGGGGGAGGSAAARGKKAAD